MGRMTGLVRHKYALLLATLVVVLLVQSVVHHLRHPVVLDIFFAGAMAAVLLVVFEKPVERRVALGMLAFAVLANVLRGFVGGDELHWLDVAYRVLTMLFLGFAVVVILASLFASTAISGDAVLGTICGYILLAGAWANVYSLTALLLPGSFSVAPALAEQMQTWDGHQALFNYFSIVTLTTMGYGDITPVLPPAIQFSAIEAICGQFYIAVVVAQLVGLRMAQSAPPDRPA